MARSIVIMPFPRASTHLSNLMGCRQTNLSKKQYNFIAAGWRWLAGWFDHCVLGNLNNSNFKRRFVFLLCMVGGVSDSRSLTQEAIHG